MSTSKRKAQGSDPSPSTQSRPGSKPKCHKARAKRAQEPEVNLYEGDVQCFLSSNDYFTFTKLIERKVEFGRRITYIDLAGYGIATYFAHLRWTPLIELDYPCYPCLVPYFYANLHFQGEGESLRLTSLVRGIHISFGLQELADILGIPNEGPLRYMTPRQECIFPQSEIDEMHHAMLKEFRAGITQIQEPELRPAARILSRIVQHNLYPRGGEREKQRLFQTYLTYCLYTHKMTNLPFAIMSHMINHCGPKGKENMPFGIMLTKIFQHFGVDLDLYMDAEPKEYKFINTATIKQMGLPLNAPDEPARRGLVQVPNPPVTSSQSENTSAQFAEFMADMRSSMTRQFKCCRRMERRQLHMAQDLRTLFTHLSVTPAEHSATDTEAESEDGRSDDTGDAHVIERDPDH